MDQRCGVTNRNNPPPTPLTMMTRSSHSKRVTQQIREKKNYISQKHDNTSQCKYLAHDMSEKMALDIRRYATARRFMLAKKTTIENTSPPANEQKGFPRTPSR